MIELTRLNGNSVVINADFIRSVERIPDTMITLTTGEKMFVLNTLDEVVEAYKRYKRETSILSVKEQEPSA